MAQICNLSILHVAAHLGAGAGKAISGISTGDSSNRHTIVLLERPEKTDHLDRCRSSGISVHICPDDTQLHELIDESDTVVLSWWNHPSTAAFLQKLCDMPARVLLWSHVNGCNYPVLYPKFINCFDACMFTTAWSLENPSWSQQERASLKDKSEIVYGMGDFRPELYPKKENYELSAPIRIGYVGTLDYAKLHPEFLQYCGAVLDRGVNAQFVMAGEPSPQLLDDVQDAGLSESVKFIGFVSDVPQLLTSFDIFGYLLNPNTFATTENSLLEAMASGLPVIAHNGGVERAIITDGADGFIVGSKADYADSIHSLSDDNMLRQRMGQNARESVCRRYDNEENALRFSKTIQKVSKQDKRVHNFTSVIGKTPFEWFLSCCPDKERQFFIRAAKCDVNSREWQDVKAEARSLGDIFRGQSKGSVFQFAEFYAGDSDLNKLCKLYERNKQ